MEERGKRAFSFSQKTRKTFFSFVSDTYKLWYDKCLWHSLVFLSRRQWMVTYIHTYIHTYVHTYYYSAQCLIHGAAIVWIITFSFFDSAWRSLKRKWGHAHTPVRRRRRRRRHLAKHRRENKIKGIKDWNQRFELQILFVGNFACTYVRSCMCANMYEFRL